ncbi:hypothetical protein AT15_09705 [Kosmotoga arenicorallina S304]|uniref:Thiamine biosynthesis protein ThiS n=1 Tax=Kosmotoga arenicorallina S304 TaxID=1453497 RepID=A0A176K1K2_9BACT|nr:hypothetical protein [Kosmotoga arenicorallina]OAA30694.1 hypothetical protein AT15_09705 [Kosmotoga arenicorallina S304]
MEVIYGDKKWSFDNELLVEDLLKKTGLWRDPVLVMADGRILDKKEKIHENARVLIINAANGG